MKSLYIDTSCADVSIALINDLKVIDKKNECILNEHSIYVVSYIDEILKKNGISPKEIERIYVVNGPGSFTGVRIGVTIAKTYAYLNNIKVIPISSLKQLALSSKCSEKYILSIIDARNNNFYFGLYDSNYNCIVKEQFNNIDKLKEIISKYNPIIVSNDNINIEIIKVVKTDLNIEKIINYYQDKKEYISHEVNVNYLKLPQALEDRK